MYTVVCVQLSVCPWKFAYVRMCVHGDKKISSQTESETDWQTVDCKYFLEPITSAK